MLRAEAGGSGRCLRQHPARSHATPNRRALVRRDQRQETHALVHAQTVGDSLAFLTYTLVRDASCTGRLDSQSPDGLLVRPSPAPDDVWGGARAQLARGGKAHGMILGGCADSGSPLIAVLRARGTWLALAQ